jgi:transposase
MGRFVVGAERDQTTLFPPCVEDWIAEDNPVRVVDAFVEALDLGALGIAGIDAARTGRAGDHSAARLKLYVYGYLNRIPTDSRCEIN